MKTTIESRNGLYTQNNKVDFITDKVITFFGKWIRVFYHIKIPLIIVMSFAFILGYFLSPTKEKIIEKTVNVQVIETEIVDIKKDVVELKNNITETKKLDVSESTVDLIRSIKDNEDIHIYENKGIKIEIRQKAIGIDILEGNVAVRTEIWAFGDIISHGCNCNIFKTIIDVRIKYKNINKIKKNQLSKAIEFREKLKIKLGI